MVNHHLDELLALPRQFPHLCLGTTAEFTRRPTMTKITVVIPTCNAAMWIAQALGSIRLQTFPCEDIETIVVDYGSTDASIAIARWFLERQRMKGTVIVSEQRTGIGAALNVGWRTGAGDWVQFIKAQGLLAPNKIEVQADLIPRLPGDVRVICSAWQGIDSSTDPCRVKGPIYHPNLQPEDLPSHKLRPVALKVVSPQSVPLGAALIRKESIRALGGFSEEVKFAVDEHFLLNMLGIAEIGQPSGPHSAFFAEAPSSLPLFFECEPHSRIWKVGFAREHVENVLLARSIVLEDQLGKLTLDDCRDIAGLCDGSLRELQEHDRGAFMRCCRRLTEMDPFLVPAQSSSRAQIVRHFMKRLRHWTRSSAVRPVDTREQRARSSAGQMRSMALRVSEGALSRLRHRFATMRMGSALVLGAVMVIGAAALFGGILASGAFRTKETRSDEVSRPEPLPVQRPATRALIINVASTIYAEPLSSWPMPVEIGPSQRVPAGSVLQVRGLPTVITLSAGRRVSHEAWAVPVAKLRDLDLEVAAGFLGKADLALALVGADGSVLATVQTTLSIIEPPTHVTSSAVMATDTRAVQVAGLPSGTVTGPAGAPKDPIAIQLPEASRIRTPRSDAPAPPSRPERDASSTKTNHSASVAPATILAPKEVADIIAPPYQPAATAKLNDNHEAALEIPQHGAIPEVKIAAIALAHPLVAAAIPAPPNATIGAGKSDHGAAPGASVLTKEDRERVEKLIARGERQLADGNVAVARQYFLRAAEAGVARAAVLLASTYDPYEYAQLGIRGVQPNSAEARKWYKRASELGGKQEEERLLRLGIAQ